MENHTKIDCPYRDEIRDLEKELPEIKKNVNKIYNRLFVDNDVEANSLISEVRRNTNYRKKTEEIVLLEIRNKWNRYGFTVAIIVLILSTIWNIVSILIIK